MLPYWPDERGFTFASCQLNADLDPGLLTCLSFLLIYENPNIDNFKPLKFRVDIFAKKILLFNTYIYMNEESRSPPRTNFSLADPDSGAMRWMRVFL